MSLAVTSVNETAAKIEIMKGNKEAVRPPATIVSPLLWCLFRVLPQFAAVSFTKVTAKPTVLRTILIAFQSLQLISLSVMMMTVAHININEVCSSIYY